MTEPLFLDRRERLIAAVNAGQSCRSATKRIGVAPTTAIKWVASGSDRTPVSWTSAPSNKRSEVRAPRELRFQRNGGGRTRNESPMPIRVSAPAMTSW
jgi:transposase